MTIDATPPPLALAALAALRRARLRGACNFDGTNTCLVVYRDGKIVLIPPDELPVAEALVKALPRTVGFGYVRKQPAMRQPVDTVRFGVVGGELRLGNIPPAFVRDL